MRFVRKCKELRHVTNSLTKQMHTTRSALKSLRLKHGVRQSDVCDGKVRGRGRYKCWTSAMLLKASFGNPCGSLLKNGKISRLQSKIPSMFSAQGFAFWADVSASHLSMARCAVAEVWLRKLEESLKCLQTEKPKLVAVSLEFDASSVKSRVQHGVIESDATYHLLVQKAHLLAEMVSKPGELQYSQLPISPAVIDAETAECILAALHKRHPVPLWSWASTSKHFVLVLVSDSASSNLKMVNMGILRSRPSNAFVLHRLCSMHALNHSSEPIWRALGHLSPMFFTSGWMSSGSNYLALLKQVEKFLMVDSSAVRVSFDPC